MYPESRALAFVSLSFVLAASGCRAQSAADHSALKIDSVEPGRVGNDVDTPVVVKGSGFLVLLRADFDRGNIEPNDGFVLSLGGDDLAFQEVTWISAGEIHGVIPAGWPAGMYDLKVRDPRGREASKPAAVEIFLPECDANSACADADPCTQNERCEGRVCVADPVAVDLDGDGYVDSACGGDDCDDRVGGAAINPGAMEIVADGIDQNCDGADLCFEDRDGDEQGSAVTVVDTDLDCSNDSAPTAANSDDCDDDPLGCGAGCFLGNPSSDGCDGFDNDCDTQTDEDGAPTTWYADTDGDGFTDNSNTQVSCNDPDGAGTAWVATATADDCDEGACGANCFPGNPAPDICDTHNQDCDGSTDEDPELVWYNDSDGDGFTNNAVTQFACTDPDGASTAWVATATANDCDEGACGGNCFPGNPAPDICDTHNQDCDGATDEDPELTWYYDGDGDGYVDTAVTQAACTDPDGAATTWVDTPTVHDCDDAGPCTDQCSPGLTESTADSNCADGWDNDCDGPFDAADAGCGGSGSYPTPCFAVTPLTGDTSTVLAVDASCSSDVETPLAALEVRWDWQTDGTYDTAFSTVKTNSHTFATAGVYEITLEVRDGNTLSSWYTVAVNVASPGRTLTVTTGADDNDSEPYGGPYTNGLSLREAVALANGTGGADTITLATPLTVQLGGFLVLTGNMAIVGQPGVVVDGSGFNNVCLSVEGTNITVMHLEITGCTYAIEYFSGTDDTSVVRDCTLQGNTVAIANSTGATVGPGNVIYGNTAASQLELNGPLTFIGNRVYGSSGAGLQMGGWTDGSTVALNVIYGNGGAGIAISAAAGGADNLVITDNTITGNGGDGINFAGSQIGGTVVLNNIIAGNAGSGITASAGNFAAASPDYNDYWNNSSGDCSGCTPGSNARFVDPSFANPGSDDYCLQPTSLLVDQGTATGVDRNGPAPLDFWGSAPDIGACETP